ncbi:hypothetical protein CSPX01_01761 [Colletotrichum filicis]|nr:hypothetical protein CSPX01_01761 [Colletotrichum filicis]
MLGIVDGTMRVKACPPNPRNANGEEVGCFFAGAALPKLCAPNAAYGRRASPAPRPQGHLAVTSLHLTVVRRSSVLLGLPIGHDLPVDPSGVRLTWAKRGAIALSAIDNKVTTKVEEDGASVKKIPTNVCNTHTQTNLPRDTTPTLPCHSLQTKRTSPTPPVNVTPAEALARRHLSISPTAIDSSPLCASPSPNPPLQQALVDRLCPQRPPPPPSPTSSHPNAILPCPSRHNCDHSPQTKVPPPLTF